MVKDLKNSVIYAIIGIVIAGGIATAIMLFPKYESTNSDTLPRPKFIDKNVSPAISSGPLTILNSKFKLGENIFLTVRGLDEKDVGKILFYTPKGKLFHQLLINGSSKSDFNNYFKPDTSKILGICTAEDLVGNWTVVLQGTPYKNLKFEMTSEYLKGAEADITPVC